MSSPQNSRPRPVSGGSMSTTSNSKPPRRAATGNSNGGAGVRSPVTSGLTYSRTGSHRSSGIGLGSGTPTSIANKAVPKQSSSRLRCVTKRPPETSVRTVTAHRESDPAPSGLPPQPQPGPRLANEEAKKTNLVTSRAVGGGGGGATVVKPRRRYVVGVMSHCGSIYEELTRQLLATGRWSSVVVKQRAGVKTLYVDGTMQDLSDVNIHMLLGDKPSCERVIAARRGLWMRLHHGPARPTAGLMVGPRVPMGCGDDGEPRVVDFVENTRCITLKSMMVSTLLRYHRYDWNELGSYLPVTFKIAPNKPLDDERRQLLEMSRKHTSANAPMWIAKSSSGCHGDNIEIFPGDRAGVQRLLSYIDDRKNAWVAQQYIDRPLLYHRRKFDVRVMALYIRDTEEVFVHEDLVMRMSSVPYDRDSATGTTQEAKLAHITNHCIQETSDSYSAFEEGNELWKQHLDGLVRYKADRLPASRRRELLKMANSTNQSLLNTSRSAGTAAGNSPYPTDLGPTDGSNGPNGSANGNGTASASSSGITLKNAIMPQMYRIVVDSVLAAQPFLPREPNPVPTHCFQILGYDFLLDEDLKVWLLEINGAPGGPTRLVPKIMADTIELAVNPYFPCTLDTKLSTKNGYTRVYPE